MQNLFRPSHMVSRSICAENPTGGKGMGGRAVEGTGAHAARELGVGWKVNPYLILQPIEETVLADIKGPGIIEQIWATPMGPWRNLILRIYWDDQEHPSVECPFGDFFGLGWGKFRQISSLPVCVNPGSAFNSYWPMPFKKRCRVTITSLNEHPHNFYYQINYALGEIPEDSLYFHAQFRRTNPLPYKSVYTIVDGIKGRGQYVGTSMSWGSNNSGWWGEGEIKFYLDGDKDFPTICGTGTEDYFCGSYNFENQETKQYQEYSTPYAGFFVLKPDGLYQSQTRFNMYRWHITDPVRFEKDLRVTIQALGWRSGGRYLPLQDDLASVAYWYQELPTAPFPKLPDKDMLEII
ncbi:MAG TPA: DUF2961 domain-containing protein [Bacillota bacterium]|nr:DUF2961 domain-containing protein [Bacillota bacterium]